MSQDNISFGKPALESIQFQPMIQEADQDVHERLAIIGSFYDITTEDMRSREQNLRLSKARKVAVYILNESIGLTINQTASELKRTHQSISGIIRARQENIQADGSLWEEVAYLGKAKDIKKTIDQRIVSKVAEATEVDEARVRQPVDPQDLQARSMAITLMVERKYVSPREIASRFGMANFQTIYWISKAIRYREAENPLIAQQMNWIRENLLTERASSFTFTPTEDSQQKLEVSQSLPKIDQELVSPSIVAVVHDVINKVADFYNVPPQAVIGRSNDFASARARRAAIVMCDDLNIPPIELGLCFDARSPRVVKSYLKRSRSSITKNKTLVKELQAISHGEQYQNITMQTLQSVCEYYDVTQGDMRSNKQRGGTWHDRARRVFMGVMSRRGVVPDSVFAGVIGRSANAARNNSVRIEQRLAEDPRLKAEIDYLYDPFTNSRPLPPKEMLGYVLQQLELPIDKLKDPRKPNERRARRLAAFILAEETAFPQANIAMLLHDKPENISYYLKKTRKDMKTDPRLALEIDSLLPANAVNRPMIGKILRLISQRYNYDLQDLREGDETDPSHAYALGVAIKLMVEGAKYPIEAVADLIHMSNEYVAEVLA